MLAGTLAVLDPTVVVACLFAEDFDAPGLQRLPWSLSRGFSELAQGRSRILNETPHSLLPVQPFTPGPDDVGQPSFGPTLLRRT